MSKRARPKVFPLAVLLASICASALHAQTVTPKQTPAAPSQTPATPSATPPAPSATPPAPSATPPAPSATPPAPSATPLAPSATPAASSPTVAPITGISPSTQAAPISPLLLDEALRLANAQASAFQTASLNERIAAEDVRQAQAAFLPKVSVPLSYIYTSPDRKSTRLNSSHSSSSYAV